MARGRPAKKGPAPKGGENVPNVYREMLADAVSSSPSRLSEEGRAVKRRRVGGHIVTQSNSDAVAHESDQGSKAATNSELDELFEDVKPNQQSITQTDSEDSAGSDMNWEEVQLGDAVSQEGTPEVQDDEAEGLDLVLKGEKGEDGHTTSERPKRKPMTAEDKKLRLEIHKMHVCCLLAHVYLRNYWCNDENVYTAIRKLLTRKMISYLNPDEDKSQFQRSRSFMDGLTQASEAFRGSFKVTARGMARSKWANSPETLAMMEPPVDIDLPMQIADLHDAAFRMQGSRDVGVQLFCAMLRSAGVDARLVCSLQPLPFQPSQKVELDQVRKRARRLPGRQDNLNKPKSERQGGDGTDLPPNAEDTASSARRSASPAMELLSSRKRRKPPRESKYPVYWVEAFNEAVQKWVPVDPLVTKTIAKPSKFEPPAGEPENSMTYVVAFEDDGSARDVTKRYVKAYNAKTRRERVETTKGGDRWLKRVMRMYKRPHHLDRDQLEDAELATKEASEPMPRNVQDFKDHPYYALERHLRRHEAIHPRREVGKVGAGRAGSAGALEPIFRRRDVHMVKSAEKWYRLGREIKPGEQPLKRVAARRLRQKSLNIDEADPMEEDNAGTALYAAYQTILYSAPGVVDGLIPKNAYGNLDIYVPSMIPPGGIHISHPETAKAARIIGVDYADAITGFSFKGRHGTAITNGAVIASEYKEAIEEVLRAFEDDRIAAEGQRRTVEALRMWRRLLAGLRVRERIEGYEIEGERNVDVQEEVERIEEEDEGGGFFPDRDVSSDVQPTAGRHMEPRSLASLVGDEGGGFMAEEAIEEDDGDGFMAEQEEEEEPVTRNEVAPARPRDPFLNNIDDDNDGGFRVNDDDADAEEALRDTQLIESRVPTYTLPDFPDTPQTRYQGPPPSDTIHPQRPAFGDIAHPQRRAISPVDLSADETSNKSVEDVVSESFNLKVTNPPNNQIDEPTQSHDSDPPPDLASAGLLHSDLEDARMLEQLHETSHQAWSADALSAQNAEIAIITNDQLHNLEGDVDRDDQMDQVVETEDTEAQAPPITFAEEDAVEEEAADDSEILESDKGSLLSHDPEDEDAEPEWLA